MIISLEVHGIWPSFREAIIPSWCGIHTSSFHQWVAVLKYATATAARKKRKWRWSKTLFHCLGQYINCGEFTCPHSQYISQDETSCGDNDDDDDGNNKIQANGYILKTMLLVQEMCVASDDTFGDWVCSVASTWRHDELGACNPVFTLDF